jgi:hypothetical protein
VTFEPTLLHNVTKRATELVALILKLVSENQSNDESINISPSYFTDSNQMVNSFLSSILQLFESDLSSASFFI